MYSWDCFHCSPHPIGSSSLFSASRLHRGSPACYHIWADCWQRRASGKGLPDTLIKAQPRKPLQECSTSNHSLLPCRCTRLLSLLSPLLFSSLLLFFLPSSACCFNSPLIKSHVPHKVLISRLPCMGIRQTHTHTSTTSHKNACVSPESLILDPALVFYVHMHI